MTRDEIAQIVKEAIEDATLPFSKPEHPKNFPAFCESFYEQVIAKERKACVEICMAMEKQLVNEIVEPSTKTTKAVLKQLSFARQSVEQVRRSIEARG